MKLLLYRAARLSGLFAASRYLTRGRLRILCYHGFAQAEETQFRPKLFIAAGCFRRRLTRLQRAGYRVLPLDEALRGLRSGTNPPLATVITIDDGFHGVLARGVPVLEELGYPATVYVTTYYVTHPVPVYRLAVQYMFWRAGEARGAAGELLPEPLRPADGADAESLTAAFIEYGESLDSEADRQLLLERLGERLQVSHAELRQRRILSLMTLDELRELAGRGIAVELHTHRHRLPNTDRASMQREIVENRAVLSRVTRGPAQHFCYPSGFWHDRQWPWLRDAAVVSAVTCDPGLNDAATNPLALRRILDSQALSDVELEAELSGFAELLRSLLVRLRLRPASGAPALAPDS